MQQASASCRLQQYLFNKNDLLGKGATGSVFSGLDTNTGQKVAIKVIDMSKINNEVTIYLLNNEKRALQTLKHPNIVRTLNILQDRDNCNIITEFCNEGTVSDLIEHKGRLSQDEALALFRSIAEGYKACVQQGIIHRDIKPANVLLSSGTPKLSDFGYCEIIGTPKPKMFYNVGSPSYMAPEAFVVNLYSEKSDVWSLGVTLYEMVVGQTFDGGGDMMDCIANVGKFGVPYPGHVSQYFQFVINQCLHMDPNKRINVEELIRILDNKEQVCQRINKTNPPRTFRANTETDAPRQQAQQQMHRNNTVKQMPTIPNEQQIMQNFHQRFHQQIPHSPFMQRPQAQQRPPFIPQIQRIKQLNSPTRTQMEQNLLRPVTHYEYPNHYQQIYSEAFHQNSNKSIQQEQQQLPRLLSHHVRLQTSQRGSFRNPEPFGMMSMKGMSKPNSPEKNSFQINHNRVPSIEQSIMFNQSLDLNSNRSTQGGIFIPSQRPPSIPSPQSYRSVTIPQAHRPPRPSTNFVTSQQAPRCVTAMSFPNAPSQSHHPIVENAQFTQKPFQKPQTMKTNEVFRPSTNFMKYESPSHHEDTFRKNIAHTPGMPFQREIPRPPFQSLSHKNPQIPIASFKKPGAVKPVPQQYQPPRAINSLNSPTMHRQPSQQMAHPLTSIATLPPNSQSNPFSRQPTQRTNLIKNPGNGPSPFPVHHTSAQVWSTR